MYVESPLVESYYQLISSKPPGIPCITDCVMAELEKLGVKYRIALKCVWGTQLRLRFGMLMIKTRVARDPRFERLPCSHKGTYADDCIVQRVMQVSRKLRSYEKVILLIHFLFPSTNVTSWQLVTET